MNYSVYSLLNISNRASPQEIMKSCQNRLSRWTLRSVIMKCRESMSVEKATVCGGTIFREGEQYLKSIAFMLLDPSARQCYDAWLDVRTSPTSEKVTLTRARLSWFNGQASSIKFSDSMIQSLGIENNIQSVSPRKRKLSTVPVCRQCRGDFSFDDPYLVLHCHCTTRVGHVECLDEFSKTMHNKCPVCRQRLLKRHQVSKYLFWNVREKFKFIS